MKRIMLWIPIVAFIGLGLVLASGLFRPGERVVRSAMIGQPLPAFALPPIVTGQPGLASTDFGKGEPRLLNIFASWCAPCIAEAPVLMQLKQAGVKIDGVAIRDTTPALQQFLVDHGNPFERIGNDPDSRVQIAVGSAGVPESFVIDARGRIAHQHVGDIKAADVPTILAAIEAAR